MIGISGRRPPVTPQLGEFIPLQTNTGLAILINSEFESLSSFKFDIVYEVLHGNKKLINF